MKRTMIWRHNEAKRPIFASAVVVVLALGCATAPGTVLASPAGYDFTEIARLGSLAPGGGEFTFDFEPSAVNNSGQVAFTADLTTGGEGIFLARRDEISEIMRPGDPAPGGGIFDSVELGRIGLNQGGDLSFAFTLDPLTSPIGLNAGVYRFSHSTQSLSKVMMPDDPAPGGGTFKGAYFNTSINNRGDIVFSGFVTDGDIAPTTPPGSGAPDFLGTGLFVADRRGNLAKVVGPGDPAPGGGTFDVAVNGWINDGGDIAFGGHEAGEECIDVGEPLVCGESVYLRTASTGLIQSIAHQGDPSPRCGTPYRVAFGPVVNGRGDIVFIGDLTPTLDVAGVFLFTNGGTTAVACPGDPMPGGGTMLSAGTQDNTYGLNNAGDVSFAATLSDNAAGIFVFSKGSLHLVARTGTVIPGLGTLVHLGPPDVASPPFPPSALCGGLINERGQVLFSATLRDGNIDNTVLLLATPNAVTAERSH